MLAFNYFDLASAQGYVRAPLPSPDRITLESVIVAARKNLHSLLFNSRRSRFRMLHVEQAAVYGTVMLH
jgi:hypothetical protein